VSRSDPYGDGQTFNYGGAMFRASMLMCDDCNAVRPLAWWGEHIRICRACADIRLNKSESQWT
jgi:hypothetical protein